MSRQHWLAPVVGHGLVEDAPCAALELADLLHQVIPVRSFGGLLLQLLKFLIFDTIHFLFCRLKHYVICINLTKPL